MKLFLFLFFTLTVSLISHSQCFNCGKNIGGFVDDYPEDIDRVSDGIILTTIEENFYNGVIYKYDFNCNLVWSFNFYNYNFIQAFKTSVDQQDNVYTIISNDYAPVNINGIIIPSGISIIKLNASGSLLWCRPIGGHQIGINIHFWNNYIFVVGHFSSYININNEINLNGAEDYYVAKFNVNGDLVTAARFGDTTEDILIDSEIDDNGNLYLTGSSRSSYYYTHITKIDTELNQVWVKEISNTSKFPGKFNASNIYYNNSNNKLYLWGSYMNTVDVLGNVYTANKFESILTEFSSDDGSLENITTFNNSSTLPLPTIGGNWRTDNISNGYMYHKDNMLYVLSSFKSSLIFNNGTIQSTPSNIYYNEDLVLFKVNLSNFNKELVLRTNGENYSVNQDYIDGPGPILIYNNNIYLTSFFQSYPLHIDNSVITNNSGNNNTDILFYKYNLDHSDLNNLISISNTCLSDSTKFLIDGNFDFVSWNFADISSGNNNTSTLANPTHIFTNSGTYNISASISCGTESQTIFKEVTITTIPLVNQISNLYGCEDEFKSQISSNFDTSSIEKDLIGTQTNLVIQYFDGNGNALPSPLPNPMTNSVLGKETITARVANQNNPECYTETTFDLIVNPLTDTSSIQDIYVCDDDYDGYSTFNLNQIKSNILKNQSNLKIEFYHENGQLIADSQLENVTNAIKNQETIAVKVENVQTNCSSGTTFKLIVNPLPIANSLDELIGCDDNNDGISEFFDTANVEKNVLGNQTGMEVTYFDSNGNKLPNPLPNPYTNKTANQELITVRVTNPQTSCYSETQLVLKTSNKPQINKPQNRYACDEGNGFAHFNTESIKSQLIGNQAGLKILYFDKNGNQLPSPLPIDFENTVPWAQTIYAKVENELNPLCYSETNFDLIVNVLPQINLENEYFLCSLQPSMQISTNPTVDSWKWTFEDGAVISNSSEATLINSGSYSITVSKMNNGISCENSFSFNLVRSTLPTIDQVRINDISGNNSIEINTMAEGDFEYSIDGLNFQDNNTFDNVRGGVYNVQVRDKKGCGFDEKEVVLVDYPKFFTPNNDGFNDYWQIQGIEKFPAAIINIFDRFGKLLKTLSFNDKGWDGTYNGQPLSSSDYWFTVELGDGRSFKGHFSLNR